MGFVTVNVTDFTIKWFTFYSFLINMDLLKTLRILCTLKNIFIFLLKSSKYKTFFVGLQHFLSVFV